MKHRDLAFFLELIDRQLHRHSGFLREMSEKRPAYKPAWYALNRALSELNTALKELRDAEPIEPAPRSKP